MTKRSISRLAGAFLSVALIAAPTAVAGADNEDGPEIRVVNNHPYQVRVLVIDDQGAYHSLGRLAPKSAQVYRIADVADGSVQVKLVVDEPVWSLGNTEEAVRSRSIFLHEDSAIQVWIEPDLTSSAIEMVQ
ncbi:MAG: hypothetical protein AMS19_04025 [Gemmatimonas sp. SG8_23]|jgi:hypothetical protein|nr:MAG: hypothetical protein AMS19_04025 [Gemmatimonas sp. SG8_23]